MIGVVQGDDLDHCCAVQQSLSPAQFENQFEQEVALAA